VFVCTHADDISTADSVKLVTEVCLGPARVAVSGPKGRGHRVMVSNALLACSDYSWPHAGPTGFGPVRDKHLQQILIFFMARYDLFVLKVPLNPNKPTTGFGLHFG